MDSYDDKGVGGDAGGRAGGGSEGAAGLDPQTVPQPRNGPDPCAGAGHPATPVPSSVPGPADEGPRADPRVDAGPDTGDGPRSGMAGLSFPYQVVAAVALSVIGMLGCVQLAMVFLHVAPANTLTKQHGEAVDEWIYPEFEQNWKLFAPNPLQQNIAVHVRAEISGADKRRTTPWMSLSGEDGKAIRGNLLPSHVQQNELRRGWDFYLGSHDSRNRPNGLRGRLSEQYIRRIVMLRLSEHDYGGDVLRIQVRSEIRSVAAPAWSGETISTKPSYRVLPWWTVTAADLPKGSAASEEADQ
ncbi:DUF5819 family protein [Streptomyces sp. NPDC001743]|uniref:DUF5819 family protein n=1 Tax=Streptomyces sp. NPDC001743 TaxID=3154397 RepID=UPI003326DC7E